MKAISAHRIHFHTLSSISVHNLETFRLFEASTSNLVNSTSKQFREDYPEPWAVSHAAEADLNTGYLHIRYTAELLLEKLSDDFNFAPDEYDFSEEFLSSNPFPSTELDLCVDPSEAVCGAAFESDSTVSSGNGTSAVADHVPSTGIDSADSCSSDEYECCEEFGGSADDE
ncbi:hypothetical protein HGRIS_001332 [Hohenbuehelia grisea]|uniref:Uncharacterized protein n=1 Tax=Hohenbuehelia grisea TaxID=104357 RepID=A0ABR3JP06_9AGAR